MGLGIDHAIFSSALAPMLAKSVHSRVYVSALREPSRVRLPSSNAALLLWDYLASCIVGRCEREREREGGRGVVEGREIVANLADTCICACAYV